MEFDLSALSDTRSKPQKAPKFSVSSLLRHSRSNTINGKSLRNEDGSLSTIRSGSVNDKRLNNGQPTLIPFIWEGREVGIGEAVERAVESGKKWPSFENHEQATATSKWLSQQLPQTPKQWDEFRGLEGNPF